MPKKFWQFRNQAADSAELLLYGDISDSSWWGDEVTPKTFADELNALGPLTSLTVRINSGGGDVFAAQTIGNLLEQHTAQVTARIDGLCASAATIIACHCDKVVAAKIWPRLLFVLNGGRGLFCYAERLTKAPQTAIFEWYCVLKLHRTAEADTGSADIGEEETQCEPIST